MPAIDEGYWRKRMGLDLENRSWTTDPYVDAVHEDAMRRAMRKIWPKGVRRIVDVGCGDGRVSAWMQEEFGVEVVGLDPVEWEPWLGGGVRFVKGDGATVDRHWWGGAHDTDMVVFVHSLVHMTNWQDVLRAAAGMYRSPRILCFGDFSHPTPPWMKDLTYTTPIPYPRLKLEMLLRDMMVEKSVAATYWHRGPFLYTPRLLHPLMVGPMKAVERATVSLLDAEDARHSAWLFRREP